MQPYLIDPWADLSAPDRAVVTDPGRFERLFRWLQTRRAVVIDYETSGLRWYRTARSVGLAVAAWDDEGRLWSAYVPYRHAGSDQQLGFETVAPAIRRLLADERILKIGHNIKFEDHFSRVEGWEIRGPRFDTMIGARLLDENRSAALKKVAATDLGIGAAAGEAERMVEQEINRIAARRGMRRAEYLDRYGYSELPISLAGYYACADVLLTGMLAALYEQRGVRREYGRIWPIEMELTRILCGIEQQGMAVDVPYLQRLQIEMRLRRAAIERQLRERLGTKMFRPSSDAEVLIYCERELRLRLDRATDGGRDDRPAQRSVDRDALEPHRHIPEIDLLLRWREIDKLLGTYIVGILARADGRGVVHGDLQQVGTTTGRLSCRNPNYQNMPSDDDDRAVAESGSKLKDGGVDPWSIRRAFVVPDGYRRVYADYSQIELRVLAHYSQDPVMVDAYLSHQDIHQRTAEEVGGLLGVELPRRVAKVINFGLSYCLSASGLARQAKINEEEAERFMGGFFGRYSGIVSFRSRLWAQARRHGGTIQNLWGRARRVPGLYSPVKADARRAERQVIGSLIQGTAAELTKESLVRIDALASARGWDLRVVNTVHDEIQFDIPVGTEAEIIPAVVAEMCRYPEFAPIPIEVGVKVSSTNWAEKGAWHG